jgi:hypothetical protein
VKFADFFPAAGLAIYAEIALALFFFAFVAVAVSLVASGQRDDEDRRRLLPLTDEQPDHATARSFKETR